MTSDKDYYSGFESRKYVITQQDLDDLVRDLKLSKAAELLGSHLQGWNLLDAHCSVTKYRNRHEQFLFITVYQMLFVSVMMSTDYSKKLRSIMNPQNGGYSLTAPQ